MMKLILEMTLEMFFSSDKALIQFFLGWLVLQMIGIAFCLSVVLTSLALFVMDDKTVCRASTEMNTLNQQSFWAHFSEYYNDRPFQ